MHLTPSKLQQRMLCLVFAILCVFAQPLHAQRRFFPGFPWGMSRSAVFAKMRAAGYREVPRNEHPHLRPTTVTVRDPNGGIIGLTIADPSNVDAPLMYVPGYGGLQRFDGTWDPGTAAQARAIAGPMFDALLRLHGRPDSLMRQGKGLPGDSLQNWRQWPVNDIVGAVWNDGHSRVWLIMVPNPWPERGVDRRTVVLQSSGPGDPIAAIDRDVR